MNDARPMPGTGDITRGPCRGCKKISYLCILTSELSSGEIEYTIFACARCIERWIRGRVK